MCTVCLGFQRPTFKMQNLICENTLCNIFFFLPGNCIFQETAVRYFLGSSVCRDALAVFHLAQLPWVAVVVLRHAFADTKC